MKRLLLIAIAGIFLYPVEGQSQARPFNTAWSEGLVVFNTGDSVDCLVRYNHALPIGILQIMKGENLFTVAPSDVETFTFKDVDKNRLRKFYSIELQAEEGQPTHAFMECLYNDGSVSILSHKTFGMPRDFMNYTWFISKPARVNKRYILDSESGQLLPMSRENALKVIDQAKSPQISAYIENHRIRFRSVSEYIDVFEYHRSL